MKKGRYRIDEKVVCINAHRVRKRSGGRATVCGSRMRGRGRAFNDAFVKCRARRSASYAMRLLRAEAADSAYCDEGEKRSIKLQKGGRSQYYTSSTIAKSHLSVYLCDIATQCSSGTLSSSPQSNSLAVSAALSVSLMSHGQSERAQGVRT